MRQKALYAIGEMPPLGTVPKSMHAYLIRQDRFGDPIKAFRVEQVEVPSIKPDEAPVYVLAAGVHYNKVWAAYGMLQGWPEHAVRPGDLVLIWGGAGGLGSMPIQITKAAGGIAVAVVSGDDKGGYCQKLGAKGYINRRKFTHWGLLPHWKDIEAYNRWLEGARAFGKAIWEVVGERKNPRLVFEHPGEDTIPTSIFVCDTGGMVVICAGTTGYTAGVDLRYLWMRQKRFQGSHFANDEQCGALNQLVIAGKVDPCLSRTFAFDEIPLCHQLMHENRHPPGNMAALVGAPRPGLMDVP